MIYFHTESRRRCLQHDNLREELFKLIQLKSVEIREICGK